MSQNDRSIAGEDVVLESQTATFVQSTIYSELLNPLDSELLHFGKWLKACSASNFEKPFDALYLLPLSVVLLENRYQNDLIPKAVVTPLLQIAGKNLLRLCEQRNYLDSGLPLLLNSQESLLPDANFWVNHPKTPLLDSSFLALTAKALEVLIKQGNEFALDLEELSIWNELLPYSMNEYLWNEEYGLYLPLNSISGQQIENDSIAGLLPLLGSIADQEQAEAMYRCLAMNFVHPLHFYFPTACTEPGHQAKTLDLFINYLLYQGLLRYEFTATAVALKKQTLDDEHPVLSRFSLREMTLPQSTENNCAQLIQEAFRTYPSIHFSNRD